MGLARAERGVCSVWARGVCVCASASACHAGDGLAVPSSSNDSGAYRAQDDRTNYNERGEGVDVEDEDSVDDECD